MSRIASSVPGRIRLRDERLRDAGWREDTLQAVSALSGVKRVRANVGACSLVVEYDVGVIARTAFERALSACVPAAGAAAGAVRERGASARRVLRQRANRYGKVGAMASLAFSMVAAAAGKKRLHIVSGGVFLAFVGLHMYIHRRHLWR